MSNQEVFQKLKKGYFRWMLLDILFGALSVVLTLVSLPLLLKSLGESVFGNWVYIGSLVGFLSLINISIGLTVTQNIISSNSLHEKDTAFANAIFAQIIVALVGGAVAIAMYVWMKTDSVASNMANPFLIVALANCLSTLSGVATGALNGSGNGHIGTVINGIGGIAGLLTQVVIATEFQSLLLLGLGTAICSIITTASQFHAATKMCKHRICKKNVKIELVKQYLTSGKYLQLSHFSQVFSTNFPVVLINAMLGPEVVAKYAILIRLPTIIGNSLLMRVAGISYPYLCSLKTQYSTMKLWNLFFLVRRYAFSAGIYSCIIFYLYFNDIILVWGVPNDDIETWAGGAVGLLVMRDIIVRSLGIFVIADGGYKHASKMAVVDVFIYLMLPIILLSSYGVYAMIATALVSGLICYFMIEQYRKSAAPEKMKINTVMHKLSCIAVVLLSCILINKLVEIWWMSLLISLAVMILTEAAYRLLENRRLAI